MEFSLLFYYSTSYLCFTLAHPIWNKSAGSACTLLYEVCWNIELDREERAAAVKGYWTPKITSAFQKTCDFTDI